MESLTKLILYRKKFITPHIEKILSITNTICYLMSLLMVFTVVFKYGFIVSIEEQQIVNEIFNYVWTVFIINTSLHLIFDYSKIKLKYKNLTWLVCGLLYLTLIPVIFNEPEHERFIHTFWLIFSNQIFLTVLLSLLSIFQISSGIIKLLGRQVNPPFIFSVSFLLFILIGTGLLMLPKATNGNISFIDALFTSTSAICVTGLTTVDVSTTFTHMGQFFIMILIQVGGLGVMTLTSFFAMFFMNNASLYNQVLMCDMVSSKSMNSLFKTLMYILGFTLLIEALGALFIFLNIYGTLGMSLEDEIMVSIFHSISAFCNAGFSTFPNNLGNEMIITGHNTFYLVISLLVILGGIGFPILVNLLETTRHYIARTWEAITLRTFKVKHKVHLYDLNTRIVLVMTVILLVGGTLIIAILEWNNAFAGMSVWDKIVQSFFNATCPRTAGFNSVSISSFNIQSILLIMLLMIIGGGTQSTAGGIKVNVFAVIMLNIRAIVLGLGNVTAFKRQLSDTSIRTSNSTVILYFFFVFVGLFILTILEPEASVLALLFECISALSTVGSSLDLTPTLGSYSKLVIIVLMFVGRVGVLTVMMSIMIKRRKVVKCKYPSDNIIIN